MPLSSSRVLRTGGLSFDGVDDYVVMSSPLSITNAITKTAWVYINPFDRNRYETIVDLGTPPSSIYLETNLHLRFMFGAYVGSGGNAFSGQANEISYTIPSAGWYFLAQVVTPSLMEGYVNGKNVGSKSGTYDLAKANVVPKIGGNYRDFFLGLIGEVRIYNRALSQTEISDIYQNGTFIKDGLVLYFDMSEYDGSTLYDKSGYGNNGTIYGARCVIKKYGRVLPSSRVLAVAR